MGVLVNHRLTTTVTTVVVTLIVSLNVLLLYQTFFALRNWDTAESGDRCCILFTELPSVAAKSIDPAKVVDRVPAIFS
jgi:hypothetical protein